MAVSVRRPPQRRAGIVYSSIAFGLVILVAVTALSVSQSPPPAIAELAPEPVEQIKDAPDDQSSELGTSDGGIGGIGGTTTTTVVTVPMTTIPPKVQPRVRRCVGTPPRQTEDPQSPPCVTWQGTDNGGATSKGVTASEIRIAVPFDDAKLNRHFMAMEAYFNKRYEFYGRKLRLVGFQHGGNNTTCTRMKADAVKADEQIDAFASLFYSIQRGAEGCYYNELARRGIMSMDSSPSGPTSGGEAAMERFAPYQWSYLPSLDTNLKIMGDLICGNLAGRPPVHARGVQRAAPTRKFGLVQEEPYRGADPIDRSLLESRLAACGVQLTVVEQNTQVPDEDRLALTRLAIVRLKDAGVTSVMCLCDASYMGGLLIAATIEGYNPEWLVQGYQGQDQDTRPNSWPSDEQKNGQIFGIRTWNKALPREQSPYWWALREGDPTFPEGQFLYSPVYWGLLMLSSGIQMAGPNLTPQAFQSALFSTTFSNVGCGGPPMYQGCVGFGPNNRSMIQDVAPVWFDNSTPTRDTDPGVRFGERVFGTYCYVNAGRRFRPGQLPPGEIPFFQGSCL